MKKEQIDNIIALIKQEVVPAIGCTEPAAVALAVAKATETLGSLPDRIELLLSGNIIKNAMVDTSAALEKAGLRSRLIPQIHDELIVEAPENEKKQAAQILKSCMENAFQLDVPLTVDMTEGKSWEK